MERTGSRVAKGVIFSGSVSMFQPQLSHLLAVWAWAWHRTSLCLGLCIDKIEMITVSTSGMFWRVDELIEVKHSQRSLAFSDYRTLASSSRKTIVSVPEFSKISVQKVIEGQNNMLWFSYFGTLPNCFRVSLKNQNSGWIWYTKYSRIFAITEILDVLVSVLQRNRANKRELDCSVSVCSIICLSIYASIYLSTLKEIYYKEMAHVIIGLRRPISAIAKLETRRADDRTCSFSLSPMSGEG